MGVGSVSRSKARIWRTLLAVVLAGGVLLAGTRAGDAASFLVTTCSGNAATAGSLPYLVTHAASGDTVTFSLDCPVSSPIDLSSGSGGSGQMGVTNSLTIDGSGHTIVISGGDSTNIVTVSHGVTLTLNDLTLEHGQSGSDGGAIYSTGTVNLTNSTVSGSSATNSGAIYNYLGGTLNLTSSTLSGNSVSGPDGQGGAIYNYYSTVAVTNSTLSGNSAPGQYGAGGAIYSNFGAVTIANSTLSGNSATSGGAILNSVDTMMMRVTNTTFAGNSASYGGAVFNSSGMTVTNSTFSGNSAPNDPSNGGAIYNSDTLNLTNSTFSGNSASVGGAIINFATTTVTNGTLSGNTATDPGGAISNSGTLTVTNTILLAGGSGGTCENIGGTIIDGGNNLEDSGGSTTSDCGLSSVNHDLIGQAPKLGPLGSNGGPTQTMALLAGSPAINAGNSSVCSPSPVNNLDQRGYSRVPACDIGAFDTDGALPTSLDFPAGWNLVGGTQLTVLPDATALWRWDATSGTWLGNGPGPQGAGAWELLPGRTETVYELSCASTMNVTVTPHRWNLVGNPCTKTVQVPADARALLWDTTSRRYTVSKTIPPGLAAWVVPSVSPLALIPS